jgi:hypothetical protein
MSTIVIHIGSLRTHKGTGHGKGPDHQKFPHAPNVIGDLGFPSRSHAKRLVDAASIVRIEPHHDCGPVVFPLLAEGTVRGVIVAYPMRTLRCWHPTIDVQLVRVPVSLFDEHFRE